MMSITIVAAVLRSIANVQWISLIKMIPNKIFKQKCPLLEQKHPLVSRPTIIGEQLSLPHTLVIHHTSPQMKVILNQTDSVKMNSETTKKKRLSY